MIFVIEMLIEFLGGGAPVREPPFDPTTYPPTPILDVDP